MNACDIMHPDDAKALRMLKKLKGFDELIRASMEYGYEQVFRGENMGFMGKGHQAELPRPLQYFQRCREDCWNPRARALHI